MPHVTYMVESAVAVGEPSLLQRYPVLTNHQFLEWVSIPGQLLSYAL
jgi:hypothetical protein